MPPPQSGQGNYGQGTTVVTLLRPASSLTPGTVFHAASSHPILTGKTKQLRSDKESFWNLGVSGLSSRSQTGAVRNLPQPSPSVDPRDSVCLIQTPTQFLFS
ncbi:Centromere Protein F [Manis pentadactyla]|nr:Centromere Protein F [Manis pentadactyla]